jgi:2-C-methyl-D-erythritol 2,4-cyclodiphosphate synthase
MTDKTIKSGIGLDIHRFIDGRPLIICGVEIPFDKGLQGYSDADVAIHAIMDALLGAAALGDIGIRFPNTDPKYKNISSKVLLTQVAGLIRQEGYIVGNIDVTIVSEKPKLTGYIPEMKERLSTILGISENCVSIKATTAERMGFIGREEGILAIATATIVK